MTSGEADSLASLPGAPLSEVANVLLSVSPAPDALKRCEEAVGRPVISIPVVNIKQEDEEQQHDHLAASSSAAELPVSENAAQHLPYRRARKRRLHSVAVMKLENYVDGCDFKAFLLREAAEEYGFAPAEILQACSNFATKLSTGTRRGGQRTPAVVNTLDRRPSGVPRGAHHRKQAARESNPRSTHASGNDLGAQKPGQLSSGNLNRSSLAGLDSNGDVNISRKRDAGHATHVALRCNLEPKQHPTNVPGVTSLLDPGETAEAGRLRVAASLRDVLGPRANQVSNVIASGLLVGELLEYRRCAAGKGSPASGEVVQYGEITSAGIVCQCCKHVFASSTWEAHLGITSRRLAHCAFLCSLEVSLEGLIWLSNQSTMKDLNWFCKGCWGMGTLLMCDSCPAAYHSVCAGLEKDHVPPGSWFCPICAESKGVSQDPAPGSNRRRQMRRRVGPSTDAECAGNDRRHGDRSRCRPPRAADTNTPEAENGDHGPARKFRRLSTIPSELGDEDTGMDPSTARGTDTCTVDEAEATTHLHTRPSVKAGRLPRRGTPRDLDPRDADASSETEEESASQVVNHIGPRAPARSLSDDQHPGWGVRGIRGSRPGMTRRSVAAAAATDRAASPTARASGRGSSHDGSADTRQGGATAAPVDAAAHRQELLSFLADQHLLLQLTDGKQVMVPAPAVLQALELLGLDLQGVGKREAASGEKDGEEAHVAELKMQIEGYRNALSEREAEVKVQATKVINLQQHLIKVKKQYSTQLQDLESVIGLKDQQVAELRTDVAILRGSRLAPPRLKDTPTATSLTRAKDTPSPTTHPSGPSTSNTPPVWPNRQSSPHRQTSPTADCYDRFNQISPSAGRSASMQGTLVHASKMPGGSGGAVAVAAAPSGLRRPGIAMQFWPTPGGHAQPLPSRGPARSSPPPLSLDLGVPSASRCPAPAEDEDNGDDDDVEVTGEVSAPVNMPSKRPHGMFPHMTVSHPQLINLNGIQPLALAPGQGGMQLQGQLRHPVMTSVPKNGPKPAIPPGYMMVRLDSLGALPAWLAGRAGSNHTTAGRQ